ncbi:MAG: UDP-N-acetylglucosamine 2-epimerase (non-hydrolyzing) [Bacteroidales bacterium]|nr:UDP-N-acetylglucosamine 2-epimerase (non-hydrolyzing) [Bacteroidales bacterium]
MHKLVTIIGARPQIIKAAAISRAIKNHFKTDIEEIIVHTGQHYDVNMSEVFFGELDIPEPDINLNVGSASHGLQTARMIEGIESVLMEHKPDGIILYGDTNSTLAGAVAAAKIHVPVIHVEAGLRSFNKSMPEEINRITCDHASTLLFSPTKTGYNNLIKEGFNPGNKPPYTIDNPGIFHCGDVMYDNSFHFAAVADQKSGILKKLELQPGSYILSTIHRNNNTDDPERLQAIFRALDKIAVKHHLKVILPLHPRTRKMLDSNLNRELLNEVKKNPLLVIIPPVSFLDMIVLEKDAMMIATDSGGVQKEAYFFKKPCLILRPETEWKEIVEQGAGIVTDAHEINIIEAYEHFAGQEELAFPQIFGNGNAASFICETLMNEI